MIWLASALGFLKRVPWQAYAIVAAVVVAFLWHRAETREAYRDGQANVWAQVQKAEADQREREREATARLELSRRLEAQEAAARTKGIDDATRNLPDHAPSARTRVRICLDLRREAKAAGRPEPSCEPANP